MRKRLWIDYEGEKLSVKEIAERAGITERAVLYRIEQGMSVERIVKCEDLRLKGKKTKVWK